MSVDRAPATTRILAGAAGTLSLSVYDGDRLADPGTVTVTVTRADGTAIVTDAATDAGQTGAAERTYTLNAAHTTQLDLLTVTWKTSLGTFTTDAEIIGEHLFSLYELRALDPVQLADGKFPGAVLEQHRAKIHDQFESICGVCFCPRYRRVVLDGSGSDRLLLPDLLIQSVRAIETRSGTSWSAWGQSDLDDVILAGGGMLLRDSGSAWPAGRRNLRVSYVSGFDRVPLDIHRAALRVAKFELLPGGITDRATTMRAQDGSAFAIATAGVQQNAWSQMRYIGLPDVDAVLNRYRDEWFVPRIA